MKTAIFLVEDNMTKEDFISYLMTVCEAAGIDNAGYNEDTSVFTFSKYEIEVQAIIIDYSEGCLEGVHADYLTGPFNEMEQEKVLATSSDTKGAYSQVTSKELIHYICNEAVMEDTTVVEEGEDPWD